jgi:two-component system CheB/CheR fusion protein
LPVPEARFESAARGWGLTRRQTQVLKEIVRGSSTKTIADALGCAHRTAQLHVSAILRKSGCKTRPALVAHFWSAL